MTQLGIVDQDVLAATRQAVEDRFFTYRQNREKQPELEAAVDVIHQHVADLAVLILLNVPDGRNRSIALTALEDVQIRSVRGLFEHVKPAPGDPHHEFPQPSRSE